MDKWKDLSQRRRALRLKEFDYSDPNYVYFVTISVKPYSSPFQEMSLAREVVNSLFFIREQQGIPLYCYCLMPDHLHLAFSPSIRSGNISQILQTFKSYTTRLAWGHGIKGKLWQRSFYDHIARKEENLLEICEYILANPVRKGLVAEPKDWPYSGLLDPLPM